MSDEVLQQEEHTKSWFINSNPNKVDFKLLGDTIIKDLENEGNRIWTLMDTDELLIFFNGFYQPGYKWLNLIIQDLLQSYTNEHHKTQIIEYIKTKTQIDRSYFNKHGYEIPLKNGIYNICSGEFREATPDDKYTYQFPIKYDPKATCPNINAFFDRILPEDDKRTVLEEIAYCFVPGYPIQNMFWWIGEGANGKGTLIRLIQKTIATKNMSFHSLHDLATDRGYCRATLFGKRVNISSDLGKKDLKDTHFIKSITGGDTIQARKIYQSPFSMTNEAKIIAAMNNVPTFEYDDSAGIYRRILVTEFNAIITIEEQATFSEDDLQTEEELSGFFNLLMVLVKDVIKNKRIYGSKTAEDVRDSLTETDSVDKFFKIFVTRVEGPMAETHRYERSEMYEDYKEFTKKFNLVPLIYTKFNSYLKDELHLNPKQRVDPVDGKKKRYYIGCIKNSAVQAPKLKL